MVSASEPPTTVSTFETVAVLAAAARVMRSLPPPRSTLTLDRSGRQGDCIGADVPPTTDSTFETEIVLTKSPRVRLSAPAPRSTETSEACARERDRVGVGATDQRLDVRDGGRVHEVAERQDVVAGGRG